MPTIIVGMHRSGTSMVTKLLYKCGLYLGASEELLTGEKNKTGKQYTSPVNFYRPEEGIVGGGVNDNPEGYWENVHFIKFNDDLLQALGGDYFSLPRINAGWSTLPEFRKFKHRAKGLLNRFKEYPHWGWKDPRNSLTLEFWQAVIPDLKVIVCVRNPAEIAHSLLGRNVKTLDEAQDWIENYYGILLQNLEQSPYLVTSYASYFYDAKSELKRVADFIGLPVAPDDIEKNLDAINTDLHRNFYADQLIGYENIRVGLQQHYQAFLAEAGPVVEKMQRDSNYQNKLLLGSFEKNYERIKTLEEIQVRLHKEQLSLTEQTVRLKDERDDLTQHLAQTQTEKESLTQHLAQVQAEKDDLTQHLTQVQAEKDDLVNQQSALETAYKATLAQLEALEADFSSLETQYSEQQLVYEALCKLKEGLEKDLQNSHRIKDNTARLMESLRYRYRQLEAENLSLTQERQKIEDILQQAENRFQEQIYSFGIQLSQLELEKAILEEQYQRLQPQYERLYADFQQLRASHKISEIGVSPENHYLQSLASGAPEIAVFPENQYLQQLTMLAPFRRVYHFFVPLPQRLRLRNLRIRYLGW